MRRYDKVFFKNNVIYNPRDPHWVTYLKAGRSRLTL
jgi:hypothetical protein